MRAPASRPPHWQVITELDSLGNQALIRLSSGYWLAQRLAQTRPLHQIIYSLQQTLDNLTTAQQQSLQGLQHWLQHFSPPAQSQPIQAMLHSLCTRFSLYTHDDPLYNRPAIEAALDSITSQQALPYANREALIRQALYQVQQLIAAVTQHSAQTAQRKGTTIHRSAGYSSLAHRLYVPHAVLSGAGHPLGSTPWAYAPIRSRERSITPPEQPLRQLERQLHELLQRIQAKVLQQLHSQTALSPSSPTHSIELPMPRLGPQAYIHLQWRATHKSTVTASAIEDVLLFFNLPPLAPFCCQFVHQGTDNRIIWSEDPPTLQFLKLKLQQNLCQQGFQFCQGLPNRKTHRFSQPIITEIT